LVTDILFYNILRTKELQMSSEIIAHNILLRRSGLQPSQFLSTARQDGGQARK